MLSSEQRLAASRSEVRLSPTTVFDFFSPSCAPGEVPGSGETRGGAGSMESRA